MNRSYLKDAVPKVFEERVALTPNKPALRYNGSSVSYSDLNARANQLGRFMSRQYNIGQESPIAVLLSRSTDAIIAILAILKMGAAYVPLDPSFPKKRLQEIIENIRPGVIIATSKSRGILTFPNSEMLYLDEIEEITSREDRGNLDCKITPDNLAYVMYTSGSTGKPKGVAGIHRSITNGLAEIPRDRSYSEEVWGLNVSLCFGASLSRLFLPLLAGIPLTIVPEEETTDTFAHVKFLERERITNVLLIAPLLREILLAGRFLTSSLRSVRTIVTGGAPLTPDILDLFREQLPHATLADGYAVTEVGGPVMVRAVNQDPSGAHIFPNTQVYVVDDDWNICPVAQAGEILVGANHLSRAYWGDPVLTAERFIPNPFSTVGGMRLYRTGDMGRFLPDGRLEVLGRTDSQVKIRGFRVEPSEIEAYLHSHKSVAEAVVCAEGDGVEMRLICHVVPKPHSDLTVRALRDYLCDRFPDYMIPSKFALLSQLLPRTANGKVDRQALMILGDAFESKAQPGYVAPNTDVELSVARIFCEVLHLEHVGITNDFLELGGHSILGIQVISRIRDRFGVEISFQTLFAPSSVGELATLISKSMMSPIRGESSG